MVRAVFPGDFGMLARHGVVASADVTGLRAPNKDTPGVSADRYFALYAIV